MSQAIAVPLRRELRSPPLAALQHCCVRRPVDGPQNARFIILIQEHVITAGWIQHNYGPM